MNKNIFIGLIAFLILAFSVNAISSVTLNLPLNNSIQSGNVLLLATVGNSDNNTNVTFFFNNNVIGTNSTGNGTYSFLWPSTTASDGIYNITAQANNGTTNLTSSPVSITVNNTGITTTVNVPPVLCSNVGDLRINDFDFDDKLLPGEDIVADVEVENIGNDDIDDVKIKLILYDNDNNVNVTTKTLKSFDLDEDEEVTKQITMSVPNNFDEDDDLDLFVFVFEDGKQNINCDSLKDDIEVDRDDEDIRIEDFTISPSLVSCGENFEVYVRVENFGSDDQDDVKLIVNSADLGILEVEYFDLDAFDGIDEDVTKRYTFLAPNIKEGSYSIDVRVDYEDGGLADSSLGSIKLEQCIVDPTQTDVSIIALPTTVTEGKAFSIPIVVKNNENKDITYEVDVAGDWVELSSKDSAKLSPGQELTLFVSGTVKSGIKGSANGVVSVKANGELVRTQPISINVREDRILEDVLSPETTIFLGVGIAALIVIIVIIFVMHIASQKAAKKIKLLKPSDKNSKKPESKPKIKGKKK